MIPSASSCCFTSSANRQIAFATRSRQARVGFGTFQHVNAQAQCDVPLTPPQPTQAPRKLRTLKDLPGNAAFLRVLHECHRISFRRARRTCRTGTTPVPLSDRKRFYKSQKHHSTELIFVVGCDPCVCASLCQLSLLRTYMAMAL
jgi:hypothetical protein